MADIRTLKLLHFLNFIIVVNKFCKKNIFYTCGRVEDSQRRLGVSKKSEIVGIFLLIKLQG